jgi:hypothetical protein
MATINRSIAQSTDDALTYNFIGWITEQVTNSTLIWELSWWDEYWIIGRFQNISIPQSATITNATLKFTSATTKTITYKTTPISWDFNCTWFTIWVIETDNIWTFSEFWSIWWVWTTVDRSTSNSVVAFTEYTTVDISSLIQVVVDRWGWSSWNSLALAIIPTPYDEYSNTWLEIISYDWDPTKVMELEITYDWWEVNQWTFLPFFM